MHNTIKIGRISYINASPVYYGLDHGLRPDWLEMVTDVPSALNRQIMAGEIEISPISAAFYAMNHRDLLLLPDLSISCHGKVLSVLLASRYPLEDLDGKKVMFSRESASAASFLKMIFSRKNVSPRYEVGDVQGCQTLSDKTDAVLVIGDTALVHPWDQVFEYCIDLGQYWYEMRKLPFVFAVWAVRRSFAETEPALVSKVHNLLLESKNLGYRNIDTVIENGRTKLNLETSRVKRYFDLLHCDLDTIKQEAMQIFFDSLFDQGILKERAKTRFYK